jgi:hypothetical protein
MANAMLLRGYKNKENDFLRAGSDANGNIKWLRNSMIPWTK